MRNRVLIAIAAAGLLTGCATSESAPSVSSAVSAAVTNAEQAPGGTGESVDPGPSATSETPPPTAGDIAAPVDAEAKHGEPAANARLTVTDIRITRHGAVDRVEYVLGGVGTPGWEVRYTDSAVQDGSGDELEVAGGSILEVRISGSAYPFDSGVQEYSGPTPLTAPDSPGITGVHRPLVFEGVTQSFIGVAGDRPAFSVAAESEPNRLVVDIATG